MIFFAKGLKLTKTLVSFKEQLTLVVMNFM